MPTIEAITWGITWPLRNYMASRLKPSPVLAGALDAAPQLGITIPGRDLHLAYTGSYEIMRHNEC